MHKHLINYLIIPALASFAIAGGVVALGRYFHAPFALLFAVFIVIALVNLLKELL
jgi:hypothetical protein